MNLSRETVAVAAQLTGVPARTITRWIREGRITVVRSAGRPLVALGELYELAEQRKHTGRLPKVRRGR